MTVAPFVFEFRGQRCRGAPETARLGLDTRTLASEGQLHKPLEDAKWLP